MTGFARVCGLAPRYSPFVQATVDALDLLGRLHFEGPEQYFERHIAREIVTRTKARLESSLREYFFNRRSNEGL